MSAYPLFRMTRLSQTFIALSFLAFVSGRATGQDKGAVAKPAENHPVSLMCQEATVAKGQIVSELDKSVLHVFHAKNNDYWFGSNDRGVYRYDGKTLVNFTTKDGLRSNSISVGGFQEDRTGNIYIVNNGVSKFDGQTFTTLEVAKSDKADWKLQPDDLWFSAGQDTGLMYRYDGKWLHPLAFPTTKDGDDHYRETPRDKFPNAKYSPYDVYTILKDSKGHLWFGTALLGACRYDGKSFTWIPESELRNGSFGTRSIAEDKDGKFWFSNSLNRYEVDLSNSAEPTFKRVDGIREAKDPNRRRIDGIISSTRDRTGDLWIATYGMGVWHYDGKNATHYPVTDNGKGIHLFSICKDNQGVMWLGTQSSGVYKFNGKTFEKFKP